MNDESPPDSTNQPASSRPGAPADAPSAEGPEAVPAAALDPLAVAEAEAQRYKDQLLRTAADFDNFRKRSRKEVEDAALRARDQVLKELLPVFDNLERAALAAEDTQDVTSVADGVKMVLRQFLDTLGKLGIERIATVGEPFDPALMEAIQQLPSTEFPPGAVTNEVLAGYRQGERLLRAALVVVAQAP